MGRNSPGGVVALATWPHLALVGRITLFKGQIDFHFFYMVVWLTIVCGIDCGFLFAVGVGVEAAVETEQQYLCQFNTRNPGCEFLSAVHIPLGCNG